MSSFLPSAFVFSSTFVPSATNPFQSNRSPIRPFQKRTLTAAVLDTPAANSYLQQHAEVVLRDFLTRRAVHTVMYYMDEMRDTPTKKWLSSFDNFSKKVRNDQFKDGDGFLHKMMRKQNEKGVYKIQHPSRSYLSRTYHFIIEPNRIAKRIYEVRDHLANEWANDLKCIGEENNEIQRMSFEKMLTSDEKVLASKRNLIFDADPMNSDCTPLRHKNYVALKTLTIQHAVARLLPFIRDQGPNHDYMYLLAFFNSYGPIKDGDTFIRELMARPVETRTHPNHLIQPHNLAVQILETRLAIAKEWIGVMEFIPEERQLLNRSILERSMELSDNIGEDIPKPKPEIEKKASSDIDGELDHSI